MLLSVGGRLLQSRDWSVISIYNSWQFRSISLACDPTLTFLRAGHCAFSIYTSIACPPILLICSCLSIAWYCLCFHLFLGGREAYMDRPRCFRCFLLGHRARDCTSTWSNPRNVYRGTRFTSWILLLFEKITNKFSWCQSTTKIKLF